MQRKQVRKPTVSLRLPARLLKDVDDLVARSGMRSRTDFIERAIDAYVEDLRDTKVVVLKPWTRPKAKAAVVKLLRGRPAAYVSDIVESLGMDPDLAFEVVDELAQEGKIE